MSDTETRSALPVPQRDGLDHAGHSLAAFDAEVAAEFAENWSNAQLRAAARLIKRHDAHSGGTLPAEASAKVGEHFARADVNADRAVRYRAIRDKHQGGAIVRSGPRVYGPDSPNSYYLDVARSALPGSIEHQDAVERLQAYTQELAVEVKAGSAEGKRAQDIAGTRSRDVSVQAVEGERRAMATGSTSGGAFVTPAYLEDDYGLFNSYPAAFLDQTIRLTDPGFGMSLAVPVFTGADTVTQQGAENSGVGDSAPPATWLTTPLSTFAGEIDISQQLFDRAGPLGIDTVINTALQQQLRSSIDAFIIAQVLAVAGTVAGAASFTAADLYGDLAKAKAAMETAAGVKIPPTHLFFNPQVHDWLLAQADPSGRPLLLPTAMTADISNGAPPAGWTGDRLLSTPIWSDGNIPASGSNTQMIVANMAEVFTLTTAANLRAVPETYANTLTVVLTLYALSGVIVRHPNAVQVLSGAAYPEAPTYA